MGEVPSEVKGVWFDVAHAFLLERHGEDVLRRMLATMDAEHRDALGNPFASTWYPEEALRQSLLAMLHVAAEGNTERFVADIEACTMLGINRFFRVLLRLSSPRFILNQVPALSKQVRRSDMLVVVDVGETKATLRYTRFPWFRERVYRLVALVQLRVLMRIALGKDVPIALTDESFDSIELTVNYG